jgi:hypothetical protein
MDAGQALQSLRPLIQVAGHPGQLQRRPVVRRGEVEVIEH